MSTAERDRWNREYTAGRWDFLSDLKERPRLALTAGMLRCNIDEELVDLGSGPGHLIDWLPAQRVQHYLGVDISDTALSRIHARHGGVRTVRASLEEFQAHAPRAGAIIASEVLCYENDAVEQLARIVGDYQWVGQVIVSVVGPHRDKPNWTRASRRVWRALDTLGWERVQSARLCDERTDVSWDLVDFNPQPAS